MSCRARGIIRLLALVLAMPASSSAADPARLASALEAARQRSSDWEGLHMVAECQRDGPMEAVEIWGSGVGVWNRTRQIRIPNAGISRLLAEFEASRFTAMPETFGGRPQALPPPRVSEGVMATEVICLVQLELAVDGETESKSVVQLRLGRQSAELRALAESFFEVAAGPARQGTEASSLTDGLRKIGTGELAPELLFVLAQRRMEGPEPEPTEQVDSSGFLLRLRNLQLTRRELATVGENAPATTSGLAADRVRRLAARLAALQPDELPHNLYAPHYTDVAIEILQHRVALQARRFDRLTPTSLGAQQARFDDLYASLVELRDAGD